MLQGGECWMLLLIGTNMQKLNFTTMELDYHHREHIRNVCFDFNSLL